MAEKLFDPNIVAAAPNKFLEFGDGNAVPRAQLSFIPANAVISDRASAPAARVAAPARTGELFNDVPEKVPQFVWDALRNIGGKPDLMEAYSPPNGASLVRSPLFDPKTTAAFAGNEYRMPGDKPAAAQTARAAPKEDPRWISYAEAALLAGLRPPAVKSADMAGYQAFQIIQKAIQESNAIMTDKNSTQAQRDAAKKDYDKFYSDLQGLAKTSLYPTPTN